MDPPRSHTLGRHSTVRDLVSTVIAAAVSELVIREDRLRSMADPDDAHQARVATRRLRAQLRTIRPVLAPGWTETINRDLKAVAAALGEVRDLDVLFEELSLQVGNLPDFDVPGGLALTATVLGHRQEAKARLMAMLTGDAYRLLVGRLQAAADDPRGASSTTSARLRSERFCPPSSTSNSGTCVAL